MTQSLQLTWPGFSGNLWDLAKALRRGQVRPESFPAAEFGAAVLEHFQQLGLQLDQASLLLHAAAQVVALQCALLSGQRGAPENPEEEAPWTRAQRLAELEDLALQLGHIQQQRAAVLPARLHAAAGMEARRPPQESAQKLALTARTARRTVQLEWTGEERWTVAQALTALRRHLRGGSRRISELAGRWDQVCLYLAATLEGVRQGWLRAEQLPEDLRVTLVPPGIPGPAGQSPESQPAPPAPATTSPTCR